MTTLNERMEFDHVIRVHDDGTVSDAVGEYAPEVNDESVSAPWELLRNSTGQYGHNGPVMHPSEYIGGGLERHIMENPGFYVAVVIQDGEGEAHGWAVAYREVVA